MDLGICYQPNSFFGLQVASLGFTGYIDAFFADNVDDHKSTSGYVFRLFGDVISWKSRKQSITATSSTEVECIGYALACKEAVWLRRLLMELKYHGDDVQQVLLYVDNQPALALTLNPLHHARTKHFEVQWHYVHEQVQVEIVLLQYLPIAEMVADGLTKPLSGLKFQRFVQFLGLTSCPTQ